MTTNEIIFALLVAALSITHLMQSYWYSKAIEFYKKELNRSMSMTDQIMIYCLKYAMRDFINDQDYESAAKCRDLINQYKKPDQKPSS